MRLSLSKGAMISPPSYNYATVGKEIVYGAGNEAVYIVDDDPTVCDALSSLLRANGKHVQMFASGAEFLHFEREDTAACVILDLKMPGMNGWKFRSYSRPRY